MLYGPPLCQHLCVIIQDWSYSQILSLVQNLDKNTIGASAILGFLQDANLTGEQLNNLGTFFYLAYLVSQIPHSYAFQRLPVAKYLAFQMFLWAVLVGATAACKSYRALGTSNSHFCINHIHSRFFVQSPFDSSWDSARVASPPALCSSTQCSTLGRKWVNA
jgi:hypothetical protein